MFKLFLVALLPYWGDRSNSHEFPADTGVCVGKGCACLCFWAQSAVCAASGDQPHTYIPLGFGEPDCYIGFCRYWPITNILVSTNIIKIWFAVIWVTKISLLICTIFCLLCISLLQITDNLIWGITGTNVCISANSDISTPLLPDIGISSNSFISVRL